MINIKILQLDTTKDLKFYEVNFTNRTFTSELYFHFNPIEHYNTIEFIKAFFYCEKNNIKMVCVGTLNQLPVLSTFCHTAIVYKTDLLHTVYGGTHTNYIKTLELPFKFTNIEAFCNNIKETIYEDDIVEYYKNFNIYITKEAYDDFINLKLESDKIWCEIKGTHKDLIDNIRRIKSPMDNIIGPYKTYQQQLLQKINHSSYMSINILSSIILNYKFICGGGSAGLFSLLPVNLILGADFKQYLYKYQSIKTHLNIYHFGVAPIWLSYERNKQNIENKNADIPEKLLHDNFSSLQDILNFKTKQVQYQIIS